MKETTTAQGFTLALANVGVIHRAVQRLGLHHGHQDYDDLVQDGILIYAQYYAYYREPLDSSAALVKFNRLAGKFVYLGILKQQERDHHHREIEAALPAPVQPTSMAEVVDSAIDTQNLLVKFANQLTPRQRQVLHYRYDKGLSDAEIAQQLHVTTRNVRKIRTKIADQYRRLVG